MSTRYDERFYEEQSAGSLASARIVLRTLFGTVRPASIVDFGCGAGTWVAAAMELGVADSLGIDGDHVERDRLRIPADRFRAADLTEPLDLGRSFDLVISLEVAEHLPPRCAEAFVDTLTRHGRLILFAAALPYQGGTGHINENWLEYWLDLFAEKGFEPLDILRRPLWREADVEWWYRQNIVLLRDRAAAETVFPGVVSEPAHSLIHPEFFLHALRRTPTRTIRAPLAADVAYYRAVGGDEATENPGYGSEFDDPRENIGPIRSFEELKAATRRIADPVLDDALAPICERSRPPAPLTPGETPPNFICIGVQKSATTWLYRQLEKHPATAVFPVKELNYFNRRAFEPGSAFHPAGFEEKLGSMIRQYAKNAPRLDPTWLGLLSHTYAHRLDQQWYEAIFRFYPKAGTARGDLTPEYAMLPQRGIDELVTFAPNAKLILMLRDPVDRIVSHLGMIASRVPGAIPFLADIARAPSVVARSRYDLIVPLWAHLIDEGRLIVVTQRQVQDDPEGVAVRLADHLGIAVEGFDRDTLRATIFGSDIRPELDAETLNVLATTLGEARRILSEFDHGWAGGVAG